MNDDDISQEPTRRDQILAAFDQLDGAAAKPTGAEPAPERATTAQEGEQRQRGEDGRFKSVSGQESALQSDSEAPTKAKAGDDAGSALDISRPPSAWKPATREFWAGLPEEVRKEVLRRESEAAEGYKPFKERAEAADALLQEFQPFRATLNALGVDEKTAIRHLMGVDHILRYGSPMQKLDRLMALVNDYGIDLAPLFQQAGEPPTPQNQGFFDPRQVAQLVDQTVANRLGAFQAAQETQSAKAELNAFMADKSNEFFDDVRPVMADLIESGRAESLKDAYEQACWLVPDIREVMIARRNGQLQQQGLTQRQEAAKAAAVNGRRDPGVMAAPAAAANRRQAIEAAWDQLQDDAI